MPRAILIDDRVGSRELLPHFRRLGIPAEITRLDSADLAFVGNGPEGDVQVGVERKTIYDLLGSLTTGRLPARQLPALVRSYDYRWIVVEGQWRLGRDSRIEVFKKFSEKRSGEGWVQVGGWFPARTQLSWHQVHGLLVNMEVEGAVWVERTQSPEETAELVGVIHRWWQKDWERHRGHLALEKGLTADRVLMAKPSYPRLFANLFPGVGWEKSLEVARRFHTIENMVEHAGDWAVVPGIGKKIGAVVPMIIRGDTRVERTRE